MAIDRIYEDNKTIVQLLYKGEPITPKMKTDDPMGILNGTTQALEKAYQKLRDAGL